VSCAKESKINGPASPSYTLRCSHCGRQFSGAGWMRLQSYAKRVEAEKAFSAMKRKTAL
jgi:NMD protein affecting ribosome stability and mRNA decay